MTLSALRLQRCRGLYRGGCGFCGSLYRLARLAGCAPILTRRCGHQLSATVFASSCRPPAERITESSQPTIFKSADFPMGTRVGVGECDGCDDCDGIFDTAPAVILIVTTVTNRHTVFLAKLMKLPLRVRFTVYSTLYSFRKSPALTLSLRVKMLGCISSPSRATSSVALPFHTGLSSVITAAILSSRGSGGLFQSTQRCAGRSNER